MAEEPQWAPPPPGSPAIGGGRYRLATKIGAGGMAAVYRAWDTREQVWRAIKVLLPQFASQRKLRRRFENEAEVMRRITHRHVIEVFDVGTDGALPYYVAELAEGGSIMEWCHAHGAMPPRTAVDVAMQICKGVGAAHQLGVIHRDVKPHNVLVTRREVCKVTDFGIAQAVESGGMTKTGSVLGTVGYMSPEQRTDAKNVGPPADVYGIGATLFTLVTGGTVADLFLAEHDDSLLEGIPAALAPLILKATAYKPDDRYQTVTALAKALHAVRKKLPEDPSGIPSLVLPEAGRLVDAAEVSQPTFPEIADVLEDPDTDLDEKKVLPYFMPDVGKRGLSLDADDPDALPDYIDRESLVPHEGGFDVAIDEETRRRAAEARQRSVEEGQLKEREHAEREKAEIKGKKEGLDAAENLADLIGSAILALLNSMRSPIQAMLIPLAILTVVGGGAVGTGAMLVRNAASATHEARATFYDTLGQERLLLDELTALGSDRRSLETLFLDFQDARGEPRRMDAAMRLVNTLEDELERGARRPSTVTSDRRVHSARERMERIAAQAASYDAARVAWDESTQSVRGGLAVGLGMATAP